MVTDAASKEIYAEVQAQSSVCQKALRHCKPGERLNLEVGRDERTGGSVIKVLRDSGELVGYLPENIAEGVAPEFSARSNAEVFILLITDGELYNKRSAGRLFSRRPRRCYIKMVA